MESYEKLEKQWNNMKERQRSNLEKKVDELELLLERERKAINWLVKKVERYEEALKEIEVSNSPNTREIARKALTSLTV